MKLLFLFVLCRSVVCYAISSEVASEPADRLCSVAKESVSSTDSLYALILETFDTDLIALSVVDVEKDEDEVDSLAEGILSYLQDVLWQPSLESLGLIRTESLKVTELLDSYGYDSNNCSGKKKTFITYNSDKGREFFSRATSSLDKLSFALKRTERDLENVLSILSETTDSNIDIYNNTSIAADSNTVSDESRDIENSKDTFFESIKEISGRIIAEKYSITKLREIKFSVSDLIVSVANLSKFINGTSDEGKAFKAKLKAKNMPPTEKETKIYKHIIELLKKNNLIEAKDKCKDLISKFVKSNYSNECTYWIGEISYTQGNYNEAYAYFAKYIYSEINYNHKKGQAMLKLILILLQKGNKDAACKVFYSIEEAPLYIKAQLEELMNKTKCQD